MMRRREGWKAEGWGGREEGWRVRTRREGGWSDEGKGETKDEGTGKREGGRLGGRRGGRETGVMRSREQRRAEGWESAEGLRVRRRKGGKLGEWRDEEEDRKDGEVRRRNDDQRSEEEVEGAVGGMKSRLEEAEGMRRRKPGGTRRRSLECR